MKAKSILIAGFVITTTLTCWISLAYAYDIKTIKTRKVFFSWGRSDNIALKDHTRPDHDETVPTPEYIRNKRNEPVAYAIGSTLSVKAVFKATEPVQSAWIGSSQFDRQLVTFTNNRSKRIKFTAAAPLDLDVGVHTFTIDWYFCDVDGTGEPSCAAPQPMRTSAHPVYITHGPPAGSPPFFKTVVEWSSQWTETAATDDEIVQGCFDGIWGLGSIGYQYVYPFYGRTGDKVDDILDQQEGACSEWAIFLLRCIEAQGVDVYTANIVPDRIDGMSYSRFYVDQTALGGYPGPWVYSNHVVVIHGGDFDQAAFPYLGTAYDPTYHLTGPGWGGYEDVLIDYLGTRWNWYENPGFGGGPEDDVLNTKLLEAIDDWDY